MVNVTIYIAYMDPMGAGELGTGHVLQKWPRRRCCLADSGERGHDHAKSPKRMRFYGRSPGS